MRRTELWLWIAVGIVLAGLTIPWFLWGSATVVAGLPIWLWWHVGWMGLASIVFWLFAQRAWGIGIETAGQNANHGSTDGSDPARETGAGTETGGEFR